MNEDVGGERLDKPIVIEFFGGGFVVVPDTSKVTIYLSRHDIHKIEYVMLEDTMIPGDTIQSIKGASSSGRIRYC